MSIFVAILNECASTRILFFLMRRFIQNILFCAVALCPLTACQTDDTLFPEPSIAPELSAVEGEVRLVLSDDDTRANYEGMTRAMLAEDGKSLLWQAGDKFKLVAKNSDGADAFDPCTFSYWTNTSTTGRTYFRGVPNQTRADGSYTYSAVHPYTASIDGTKVTFTLPVVQDGSYGKTDFMVARSTGGALQVCDSDPITPEPLNDIGISFKHQLHALRFEIPRVGVLTSGIRRVHILFSEAVVGDIRVDMETNAVEYVNASNKITVDFGAGNEKQAGETFWVMTLPQAAFSRAVDIRFEDSQGNFTTRQLVTFPSSQQYTAGRLTPVKINVPSSLTGVTSLHCKISSYEQLGEPITNLHLTLPAEYYFTDYAVYRNSVANSNGEYVYSIFDDMFDSTLRNYDLKLDYESKNAFIPTAVKLENTVNVGGRTDYSLVAPYLFFENFDGVGSFNSYDEHQTANAGSKGAYSFLNGWTGGRIGGKAGLSVRLACRRETSARYASRLDSPVMSYLKSGASVNVKVTYDYGTDQQAGGIGPENAGQTIYEGRTTDTSALASGNDSGTFESNFYVDDGTNDGNGDYSNLPHKNRSFTFGGCTNGTRISWRTMTENFAGLNNNTCWLYIDNVRVSIAQ